MDTVNILKQEHLKETFLVLNSYQKFTYFYKIIEEDALQIMKDF